MAKKGHARRPKRVIDPARFVAYQAIKQINGRGGYSNLVLNNVLDDPSLDQRDRGFITELVATCCRAQGVLDLIIEAASGQKITYFQPEIRDILRLATTQILLLRTPVHASTDSSVNLAGIVVGERVTGLVNAVCRRIIKHDLTSWITILTEGMETKEALGVRTMHPNWIVKKYAEVLPEAEVLPSLEANNIAPIVNLVVRPGLLEVEDLAPATPAKYSPYGAYWQGPVNKVKQVRQARAGVQDEGSQLVSLAGIAAQGSTGADWWLDMCAGPGGKAALVCGIAGMQGKKLLASEIAPHRARLVAQSLRAYDRENFQVICTDSTKPSWQKESFSKVFLDAPCSGLGSLRRRAESRWRKNPADLGELTRLQLDLLNTAIWSTQSGGIIVYITCSPTKDETFDVVTQVLNQVEVVDAPSLLPQVPDCRAQTDSRFIQLWPHRHQTDAMFCAILRKK